LLTGQRQQWDIGSLWLMKIMVAIIVGQLYRYSLWVGSFAFTATLPGDLIALQIRKP
jgi:hypothetical protein